MSKKLADAIESGEVIEGPSMGAQITSTPCSICGKGGDYSHSSRSVGEPDVNGKFSLISFSLVGAPKCDHCDQPMQYLNSGTEWTCRDTLCKAFNVSISTGIGGLIQ